MSTEQHFTEADRVALERYLDAQGWEQTQIKAPLLKQWAHQDMSVQVPQDATLIDFDWLMERALERVARVEQRSPDKVLEALRDAALDVVRVRLGGADELPLKQGIEAIDALPKLIQAAALAERSPRAHYASRLPDKVIAYMDSLILKQTEAGSFVLRLASPLGEPQTQGMLPGAQTATPYGRLVTAQLARSVQTAAQATAQAVRDQRLDALEEAVPHGVSANMLDALAAFGEACEDRFVVELDWASALAAPALARSVTFERAWTPTMLQAAASFRKQPAGPRQATITGLVRRLDELRASEGDTPRLGKIGLWATIDGKLRQVEVELAGPDYQIAVSAHEVEALINVSGTLDQQQRKWVLLGAHGVERWREQDDE